MGWVPRRVASWSGRLYEYDLANERSGVTDAPRYRKVYWRGLVVGVLGIVALCVYQWGLLGWVSGLLIIPVGYLVGRSALNTARRAQAYRNGWLDGRRESIRALAECQARGMTPQDWLEAQMEKDFAVMEFPYTCSTTNKETDE